MDPATSVTSHSPSVTMMMSPAGMRRTKIKISGSTQTGAEQGYGSPVPAHRVHHGVVMASPQHRSHVSTMSPLMSPQVSQRSNMAASRHLSDTTKVNVSI